MTDLPALREAVAKMTPGPFRQVNGQIRTSYGYVICDYATVEDAQSIVDQLNAFPALLDEVEALRAGHARLRAALVALVGVDTVEELDAMEAFMRNAPAPAEDKAATIDAIHALKAVRP